MNDLFTALKRATAKYGYEFANFKGVHRPEYCRPMQFTDGVNTAEIDAENRLIYVYIRGAVWPTEIVGY